MKKIFLSLATIGFVSMISFAACGSGDPCTATSSCSADPKPTDAQIKACQDQRAGITKCKTEADAFGDCQVSNRKCTADKTTDGVATLAACKTQFDAYTTCTTK